MSRDITIKVIQGHHSVHTLMSIHVGESIILQITVLLSI